MIGKVMRGSDVRGLLRYLFGPGRANEHSDPHVAGAFDPQLAGSPEGSLAGEVRRLGGLLEQPLHAASRVPERPVWHCAIRAAPGDRRLTDAEWAALASDVVTRTGLATTGDDGGCRWVAVRHAEDHIHLVVTLARQDGRAVRLSNDYYRLGEACRAAEDRLDLARTPPRDRTASKRPTRPEREKAARAGAVRPPRERLRGQVRAAAAAATGEEDFLDRLVASGLLVRRRESDRTPGQITGYAVALPGDRTRTGQPVWFGGSKLAADLSWTKLRQGWSDATAAGVIATSEASGAACGRRLNVWNAARRAAVTGAADVRRLADADPVAAGDVARAAADLLAAAARLLEGRAGGRLTDAADAFARASRLPWGRTAPRTPHSASLRSTARALALLGRAARDETTQVQQLLTALTALADAVAALRDQQHRTAQAAAARHAAQQLRPAAAGLAGSSGSSPTPRLPARQAPSTSPSHDRRRTA